MLSTHDHQLREPDARTTVLTDISQTMVRLYKELFGRGPTKVRSHWVGPDALSCFLEDTLTRAEQNLVRLGEHERLRDTRLCFQYATIREFCEPVERLTGRKVRSFHSSIDTQVNGLSIETFIFYPDGEDGPSRSEPDGNGL